MYSEYNIEDYTLFDSKQANMRELPSQGKGARFRAWSRRSSCVRIASLASKLFKLIFYTPIAPTSNCDSESEKSYSFI